MRPSLEAESKGRQNKYLKSQKLTLCTKRIFNSNSNSINDCDFIN